MNYINKTTLAKNPLTVAQLRKMVRVQRNELNARILFDEGTQNVDNARMIITSGNVNEYNKVMMNKPIEFMNKQELIEAYNEFIQVINADMTSSVYHHNITDKDEEQLKKFNKARRKNNVTTLNMQQFQEYIQLVDEFPDLFKSGDLDYREIIDAVKEMRRYHQKPLIELMREAKNDLEASGNPYTQRDILINAQRNSTIARYQEDNVDPKTGEMLTNRISDLRAMRRQR